MSEENSTVAMSAGKAAKPGTGDAKQYLTFMLAGEEYGVDILRVQEIKGWDTATRIPRTPSYVLGVINLRGSVVPVLGLRQRLGLEAVDFGPTTVVIVLRARGSRGERTVGIVVDAVSEVYNIDETDLKAPPDECSKSDSRFVKALAMVEKKMLILLDVDLLVGEDANAADAVLGAEAA